MSTFLANIACDQSNGFGFLPLCRRTVRKGSAFPPGPKPLVEATPRPQLLSMKMIGHDDVGVKSKLAGLARCTERGAGDCFDLIIEKNRKRSLATEVR